MIALIKFILISVHSSHKPLTHPPPTSSPCPSSYSYSTTDSTTTSATTTDTATFAVPVPPGSCYKLQMLVREHATHGRFSPSDCLARMICNYKLLPPVPHAYPESEIDQHSHADWPCLDLWKHGHVVQRHNELRRRTPSFFEGHAILDRSCTRYGLQTP